jgi:FkbM family methyltransferase
MDFDKPEFLAKFRPAELPQPPEGCFTNWLGLVTDASTFANGAEIANTVRPDLPVGNIGDGVYGAAYEYGAVLMALDVRQHRDTATAVELGCGWAPWISAFGVTAKRMGFADIRLVGVEAEATKCEMARAHLARNHLAGTIIQGAAWKEDTVLQFGVTDPLLDHGGAVTEKSGGTDYRGFKVLSREVPAYSLATICKGLGYIDLMHWDIQGAEFEVANAGMEFLNSQVHFLFCGTHSPLIEGKMIDLFYRNGWDLLWRDPVPFTYDRHAPSLEAMVLRDGEMFLRNPRLDGQAA